MDRCAGGIPRDDVIELRIHGVGGPQGPKILGWTSEADVETLPRLSGRDGALFPPDPSSRFVRPLRSEGARPQQEGFEWGALTTGLGWNLLWVVFLPFTLLNVGGWARAAAREVRLHRTVRDLAPRMLGYLATATYVLWVGYLTLELAGAQWQSRLAEHDGLTGWLGRNVLPVAAVVVFLGALVLLAVANVRSGTKFENANPDRPAEKQEPGATTAKERVSRVLRYGQVGAGGLLGAAVAHTWLSDGGGMGDALPALGAAALVVAFALQRIGAPEPVHQDAADPQDEDHGQPPQHWDDAETVVHRNFFAHHRSVERLRHRHFVVAATTAGLALWLAAAGRNDPATRLGLTIVAVATVEAVALVLVWVFTLVGALRRRATAKERFTRAGLLSLGIVLSHAVFAGAALWLRDRLATIPGGGEETPLPVGPELGLSDLFLIALLAAAVLLVVAVAVPRTPREHAKGLVVKVARRLPKIGVGVALAFVVTFFTFSVVQAVASFRSSPACEDVAVTHRLQCWYGDYDVGSTSMLQSLGTKVLLLLPVALALAIRTSSTVGRVLGNFWDVLTFWPRRYQPLAVPSYAERAVPELRRRLELLLIDGKGVILAGHSQGSVLSVAAVAPLLPAHRQRLFLLSFGSPLGTLYGRVFPIAIGPELLDSEVRAPLRGDEGAPERWKVLWRATDPIGGPVFENAAVDEEVGDPPSGDGWATPGDVLERPPLDRPPRWGVVRGHGWYPSEARYRVVIDEAATLVTPPSS